MEVKEAIEWIEDHCKKFEPSYVIDLDNSNFDNEVSEIISLLKQGEKYRQMWEELRHSHGWVEYDGIPYVSVHSIAYISKLMDDVEQKYFPKEAKQ